MTEEELKNQLFKLSAQAIYHLSDGSTDPISIQEAIEHNTFFRPILYCVQILEIKNLGDSEKEITFVLSPDYLMENSQLVFKGILNELMWTFKLNSYDYGIEERIVDDADGSIDIRSEEGVENWIARGEIKILQCNKDTYQISTADFFTSSVRTESD